MSRTNLAEHHARSAQPYIAPGIIRAPLALTAAEGHQLFDWREVGIFPMPVGNESAGYSTEGDVLVTQTNDGTDLNELYAEFQATLNEWNMSRAAFVALFTYPVTRLIERVPQAGESMFEEASEFGVPKAVRPAISYFELAYDYKDYDLATRYTWKYLRDADAREIEAIHQQALNGDNRLIFRKVMEAFFDKNGRTAEITGNNYNVYPLYNGDGMVPPKYKMTTFTGNHTHYMASGDALIDSDDIEDLYDNIAEHGYGIENGTTFVAMMNKELIREVRKWRVGVENNNGAIANYDFIPASNQPALIVPNEAGLIGDQPPTTWNGLPVIGSYAGIYIVEEPFIPAGYVAMLASGGALNAQNPVGFREHANPQYRGLRLLPGNQQRYPLIDSFYSRGFGTGMRQRGGAAIMQITANATYTTPPEYENTGATA